ncbi:MAG: NfeD family protein [Nitrospirales bacterium]
MTTFTKFILVQLPGWLFGAGLLFWLWPKTGLSPWLGAVVYGAWIVKDFSLYPVLRSAYEGDGPTGGQKLIGATGVAREPLNPEGYVQIAGELWRAKTFDGEPPIPAQTPIRVAQAAGLTLFVRRAEDPGSDETRR